MATVTMFCPRNATITPRFRRARSTARLQPEARTQHAIERRGRAAALQVAGRGNTEYFVRDAAFEAMRERVPPAPPRRGR